MQLGSLRQPIQFNTLLGYEDYMNALQKNYPENRWLTPSEVFRPYYGITIGNYIHQQYLYAKGSKLRILEIGAGYGAACEGVLYYFKNYCPQLFAEMEYTVLDISTIATKGAEQRLVEEFSPQLKKGNLRIQTADFMNFRPVVRNDELWFILFLEVFDNLPHDKIIGDQQVAVDNMKEILQPMTDPLILECYDLYKRFKEDAPEENETKVNSLLRKIISKYYGNEDQQAIFLPTVSLKVLKHIRDNFKNSSLVIGDFDLLKNNYTKCVNAPIVSRKLKLPHEKQDFESYLVEKGTADIFFPTDFQFLQFMVKEVMKMNTSILKAHQFADQFSKSSWTTTKSGYNPLKEDFANTSFLLTDHS